MLDILQKQKIAQVKKSVYDLIKDQYAKNEAIIEKIARNAIDDEEDGRKFMQFLGSVYEIAYLKCYEDHKKELKRLGIKMVIKPEEK